MNIRVGAHPSNLTLTALTHHVPLQQGLRDAGLNPEFRWYADGAMMHALAESGEVNVIGTGTTRAVVAQAEGRKLAYIGASHPRSAWAAILVREDSDIHTPVDLKGRRVGLIEGSFQTYFLLAALDRVGLSYDSIVRADLKPGESDRALRDGVIDAWSAMDPYLSAAVATPGLRKVIDCEGVISNRSVFWVLDDVIAAGPEVAQTVFDAISGADDWIAADHGRAGALFHQAIGNGLSVEEWTRGVGKRQWGILHPDATLIAEQQAEADLLARHGLLPHSIVVAEATLPYALATARKAA